MVLLLFGSVVGWLSIVGLPESALRAIEESAAEQGVHIHVDRIRLAPAGGLAFRVDGLALYARAEDERPIATVGSTMVEMGWRRLLDGNYLPKRATASGIRAQVPVTGSTGECLTLDSRSISLGISDDGQLHISDGQLSVDGVSIRITGSFLLDSGEEDATEDEGAEEEESQPFSLAQALADAQPYIDEVHGIIRQQQWQPGEAPVLEIRPGIQDGKQEYAIRISVPRYDTAQFHFRKAEARLSYKNGRVAVDRLVVNTVSPDSVLEMQGAYVFETRELGFRLKSNAPLLMIAKRTLGEAGGPVLQKLHHPEGDCPKIEISGNVTLTADYAPGSIRVQGGITQHNLFIGKSQVDKAELSFSYKNGDFVLEKCEFTLPAGTIRAEASAVGGEGHADISADIDVAALLRLVSEFTEQPVALPDGIALNGRTQLRLCADLSAPSFTPGQTQWNEYVPDFRDITLQVKVDELRIPSCTMESPSVLIHLEGIKQNELEIPEAVARAAISAGAARVSVATGCGEPDAVVSGLQARWEGADLALGDLLGENLDILIPSCGLTLEAESFSYGQYQAGRVEISLQDVRDLHPTNPWETMAGNALLAVKADDVRYADTALGQVSLSAAYTEELPSQAQVQLTLTPAGADRPWVLAVSPCWANPDKPELLDIAAEDWDLSPLEPILAHFGIALEDFGLPESITLKGNLSFDAATASPAGGDFSLGIPVLVRKPTATHALLGKETAIAVDISGHLLTLSNGEPAYDADVQLRHESGRLDARVQGCGRKIAITGHNTIRADYVDLLIDDPDAHEIIRDFAFSPETVTDVSNIDVLVDMSQPDGSLRVTVQLDADVRHFAFMCCGVEVQPDKSERVRTDLGPDPFTYFDRATCSLHVDLAYDCLGPDGQPVPDVCRIFMGNARIEYDNRPWLRKQGISKGDRSSTLTGDLVLIDVEDCYIELHNVRGRVYPAYAFGAFFPDMHFILKTVDFPAPAMVESDKCVFPYDSDQCPLEFSGVIRALCPEGCRLKLLGTVFPIKDLSGFIVVENDAVLLDRLNATCWDGVADGMLRFGFTEGTYAVDGYIAASCMNLRLIAAAYENEQGDALCSGRIRFRSKTFEVDDVEAYGEFEIKDGDLLNLGIFRPVSDLISDIPGYFAKLERYATSAVGYNGEGDVISSILTSTGKAVGVVGNSLDRWSNNVPFANHVLAHGLKNASGTFTISKGKLISQDLVASGTNLAVNALISIDLNTLQIRGNIWPRIYSLSAVIITPISFLSNFVIDISVSGTIDNLKWGFGLDRRPKGTPASASTEAR